MFAVLTNTVCRAHAWTASRRLADNRVVHAVVKTVNLRKNRYRDTEHRNRSVRSYEIEVNFYKHFSDRLQQVGAKVPKVLYQSWEADHDGLTLVLEDLSCQADVVQNLAEVTRLTHQALGLDFAQAGLALEWLSRMHTAFRHDPAFKLQHIWPQGSYWSLEKRKNDVACMPEQWSKTVAAFSTAFPAVFAKQSVQNLGQRLATSADSIQLSLQACGVPSSTPVSDAEQPVADASNCSHDQYTVIHGDFKTANLFFSPSADAATSHQQHAGQCSAPSVSVCDFQWCGGGIGEQDVMYLIWSSVQPDVVRQQEMELLRTYHNFLQARWCDQQQLLPTPAYSFKTCCHRYQLSFLDYVRFLVGAMWGTVTPMTCKALKGDINQGLHKRSARHLAYMVSKADAVLQQLEHSPGALLTL